ncbi:hypothetical protein L1887_57327 [Cichorium endivia]|nr:hypothetical protein L1887_57327 [Cichorium endivia]
MRASERAREREIDREECNLASMRERFAVSCSENADLGRIAFVRAAEQARRVSAQASMARRLHEPGLLRACRNRAKARWGEVGRAGAGRGRAEQGRAGQHGRSMGCQFQLGWQPFFGS